MNCDRRNGRAARAALGILAVVLPGCELRAAGSECSHSSGLAVAATATSATSVSLFWQATPGTLGSEPATSYALFRGTSPNNLAQIAKTTAPFYENPGLTPATAYLYVVETAGNNTTLTGAACATTPPLPNPPYDITATPASPTQVTLSWAEKIDPDSLAISAFRVYEGTSPGNLTLVATVKAISAGLNAAAGTTYYFSVVAVDVDGDSSAPSVTIQVTTPNQ